MNNQEINKAEIETRYKKLLSDRKELFKKIKESKEKYNPYNARENAIKIMPNTMTHYCFCLKAPCRCKS